MRGSSAEPATVRAKVRPRQIYCLLDILHGASVRQRSFFAYLRLWARNVQGPANQAELDLRAQERVELGRAAELAVLDWEKRRLGSLWSDRVRHIADRSPAACYDIQSL